MKHPPAGRPASTGSDRGGRGKFPYDELITEFSFDQINEAEAASASGQVIKPVLRF